MDFEVQGLGSRGASAVAILAIGIRIIRMCTRTPGVLVMRVPDWYSSGAYCEHIIQEGAF